MKTVRLACVALFLVVPVRVPLATACVPDPFESDDACVTFPAVSAGGERAAHEVFADAGDRVRFDGSPSACP